MYTPQHFEAMTGSTNLQDAESAMRFVNCAALRAARRCNPRCFCPAARARRLPAGTALDLAPGRAHLRGMPIHEYVPKGGGCPTCRAGIERLQRLSDPPLERCPDCGTPLERAISAPQVVAGGAHRLKEGHLEKHGFTQYRKVGKGKYEKTAGKGPPTIQDD
jgi:putative FmdB family regulatory protein